LRIKTLISGLAFLLLSLSLSAQLADAKVFQFQKDKSYTLAQILSTIESKGYIVSYNPRVLPLEQGMNFKNSDFNLYELLDFLERSFALVSSINEDETRIVLSALDKITVHASLIDSLSGESIIGAYVIYNDQYLCSSNALGYISFTIVKREASITIWNIGYQPYRLKLTPGTYDRLVLKMKPHLDFEVEIVDVEEHHELFKERISSSTLDNFQSVSGNSDLVETLKASPGVSPGGEGQNGYTVRGGGPHQNLILMDGMNVYEASHLGGLSSIFLPGAIKYINFHKDAFPARYGGRVSSVLDVRLKDGNRQEFERQLSMGLEGIMGRFDGPVSKRLSVNMNVRTTWFDDLAGPLVQRNTSIESLDMGYSDAFAKLTWWLSPGSRISGSAYWGEDIIKLVRNSSPVNFTGFQDLNRISWGNRMASLKWETVIGDQFFVKLQSGISSYDYNSRGSYEFEFEENGMPSQRAFDILSVSSISDHKISGELDYYSNKYGQFKIGAQYIDNLNRPSIEESNNFASEPETVPLSDTSYHSREMAFYFENSLSLGTDLNFISGLRWSNYYTGSNHFSYLEPRLRLQFDFVNSSVGISYSRISQFIHLLSNPGPGLPSDLWVPSTSRLAPELSDNFSIEYSAHFKSFSWGASLWYKSFDNLVEYENPSDIIYSIIIDNELYQVEVNNDNWEERISSGGGYATGIELYSSMSYKSLNLRLNYGYSRSFRQFNELNGGNRFPFRYDQPHQASALMQWKFNEYAQLRMHWQFATGFAYSLSNTERLGADGQPVLVPSSRNNFRLPDFHHLDISYEHRFVMDNSIVKLNMGVYNVYNRLNAFYEYLSEDPQTGAAELVKISIFPILPQFNLSLLW
jgi:hypothetical protein